MDLTIIDTTKASIYIVKRDHCNPTFYSFRVAMKNTLIGSVRSMAGKHVCYYLLMRYHPKDLVTFLWCYLLFCITLSRGIAICVNPAEGVQGLPICTYEVRVEPYSFQPRCVKDFRKGGIAATASCRELYRKWSQSRDHILPSRKYHYKSLEFTSSKWHSSGLDWKLTHRNGLEPYQIRVNPWGWSAIH